jgi:hypothetical protein
MESLKIQIKKNKKFSNSCEWYNEGQVFNVSPFLGEYIELGTGKPIKKMDTEIII